ncbi:MAG TPA: lytic transglycosylase domain-containing protein [Thermoanaerobaculia bacterium]
MWQLIRRRWLLISVVLLALAGVIMVVLYARTIRPRQEERLRQISQTEAPPDLEKLREPYAAGVQALQQNEGAAAVASLSQFDFGSRAVEEYRLYYLATGYQLTGDSAAARRTLATLWRRAPRMIYTHDAGFSLANLYERAGDWQKSSEIYAAVARKSDVSEVSAAARWSAVQTRLRVGDLSGAFYSARNIIIRHPRSEPAARAAAFVRAVSGLPANAVIPMTPSERLDRAVAFMAANDPQTALAELDALAPLAPSMRSEIQLQRGIVLQRLRRFEDSSKALEPLTSGQHVTAIPALRHAAQNYSVLAASIDPEVKKTVKEKKRTGSVKVKVKAKKGQKAKTVTRPTYKTVTRTVTQVDLEKKKRKEEYERLASERLRDLLSLPIDDDLRLATLDTLINRAIAKDQESYLQELVPQVIKIDAAADPALQYFWDKGWGAYQRGDLAAARRLLRFIADTYTSANVRRQSDYWFARTIERLGNKEEAAAIYGRLADAPYTDLYAIHALARGGTRKEYKENPLKKDAPDWGEIAEKEMPDELRLAYELTALGAMRDASLEIRRNTRRQNVRFAEALMSDIHHAAGNELLMYRSLRRAWPQLATVEQDSTPAYFLRMYYPLEHDQLIEENAKKNKLDPNLVRALILQESYYNPEAKSPVGATGLMQLMPATAADHAKRLRIPFATLRLENPDVNIQLGTFHLRMVINIFKGNEYLAVASYNAGQGNVGKWRRAAPSRPIDEFLEAIPFQETRNYVKRVTLLRSSYERLTM